MRVVCHLRSIRGRRNLTEIAKAAGVKGLTAAELSKIERGIELPRDPWREPLERAYGAPRTNWYPPDVLLVIQADEEAA